jgi:hypothetical protein
LSDRICPQCRTEISAAVAAAYSNGLECPQCKTRLEVASVPRTVSTVVGLAAAAVVWWLTSRGGGALGGVLPTLYAVLAFGIVSPLALMYAASLRKASTPPAPEPVHSASGPGSGAHGVAHH